MIKIIIVVLILILVVVAVLATNFGVKMTLMAKRKDSRKMLEELWYNFGTDYREYKDLPVEEVFIKSHDGLRLKGFYHEVNKNSSKVIIINHGYTANHYVTYQFIDMFFEVGYNVLLIDMRSHGESEGNYATYGYQESKDIEQWINWVKDKFGSNAYMGIYGFSMGAAAVMLCSKSQEKEVKFIIEDCGFTTAREAIRFQFSKGKVPFWPLYHFVRFKALKKYNVDFDKISPIDAISKSKIPTLFIHGENDEIIPTWMAKKLYETKKGDKDKLYIAPNAGHMTSYYKNREEYKKVINDFLDSL